MRAVGERRPELIVLEAALADLDGFEVARRVRELQGSGAPVPIIFLSARDDPADKAAGLRAGGDDYMSKPFSPEELVERVRAVLRRCDAVHRRAESLLVHGDLVLDTRTREVSRSSRSISLTPTEYRLLHFFRGQRPSRAHRDQILVNVWGYEFGGNASVLETYICYLRQKLAGTGPPLIHTVRGVGYVLRAERITP